MKQSYLLLTFLLLLSTGCASHRPYHCDFEGASCGQPCVAGLPAVARYTQDDIDYRLGFIEFDDQGQLWDRAQLRHVLDNIEAVSADNDVLIVAFAHGWMNNAAAKNGNVKRFNELLANIAKQEAVISALLEAKPRQIFGVYLGWRGLSSPVPGANLLTFWDRKNTAEKVGHGNVTEVIMRLEALRDKQYLNNTDARSRFIVIGHSFGGAVVFTALNQILQSRLLAQAASSEMPAAPATGVGDLVVLINPAFEANLYSPLASMTSAIAGFPESQRPLLAVLTSEGDSSTGLPFTLGRQLSTLFEKERLQARYKADTKQVEYIDQSAANTTAIGHFDPYITHNLDSVSSQEAWCQGDDEIRLAGAPLRDQAAALTKQWRTGAEMLFCDSALSSKQGVDRNPYLNIRVDKDLIQDHVEIYDYRIQEFVRGLILISTTSDEEAVELMSLGLD